MIELDHGKRGREIRNALTKASFNVITEAYVRTYVLFFDELTEGMKKTPEDQRALDQFEERQAQPRRPGRR